MVDKRGKKIGQEAYRSCRLCPRECGVDRTKGERGWCGETDEIRAARAALHFWEEPCISGTSGSGAVFFSGCTLRCVFCQNAHIADGEVGFPVSRDRLTEIFLALQDQGANNLNLVTADHFLPDVVDALEKARDQGLSLPVVWNSSSYLSLDGLKALDGLVDIYLPDLKYVSRDLSKRYSHAADYFDRAFPAIREMVRQTGDPVFFRKDRPEDLFGADRYNDLTGDPDEMDDPLGRGMESGNPEYLMKKGTIVRHLCLPGCGKDSREVLTRLHEAFGDRIYVSLMSQYTPLPGNPGLPAGLSRRLSRREYESLVDYAIGLGIGNAFIQEGGVAKESFIPAFDGEGIL